MGHSYKGSSGKLVTGTPATAPVLSVDSGGNLTWTYAGANPVYWQVMESADGGAHYYLLDQLPGTTFSDDNTTSTFHYYVVGTNGSGIPVTAMSNFVVAP